MDKLRAGELRHLITLQNTIATVNDYGERTLTYSDYATVFASIEPLTGREFDLAQQTNSLVTHKIRMRYLAGVTTTDRIVFGTRIFNLIEVRNIEECDVELEIRASEQV